MREVGKVDPNGKVTSLDFSAEKEDTELIRGNLLEGVMGQIIVLLHSWADDIIGKYLMTDW